MPSDDFLNRREGSRNLVRIAVPIVFVLLLVWGANQWLIRPMQSSWAREQESSDLQSMSSTANNLFDERRDSGRDVANLLVLDSLASRNPHLRPRIVTVVAAYLRQHHGLVDTPTTTEYIHDEVIVLKQAMPAAAQSGVVALRMIGRYGYSVANDVDMIKLGCHRVDLSETNLTLAHAPGVDLSSVNLNKANLAGIILAGAKLNNGNLEECRLVAAVLAQADFTGARLRSADLWGANLRDANFTNADLSHADLAVAKCEGAVFRNTNLRGANLFHAEGLSFTALEHALIDEDTTPPESPPPDWWSAVVEGSRAPTDR